MKALIIDDDPDIVEAVCLCFDLRWPDIEIIAAHTGMAGLELLRSGHPDVVILDIGLPDIDGFDICCRIRLSSDVPIIMLTVRDTEIDKARGFELGADAYMVKPFSHVELLARTSAVLRRCRIWPFESNEGVFSVGDLRIDFAARTVHRRERQVKLTPKEYDLLCLLARNAGRTVPHRVLLERIWGSENEDSMEYVKIYVQRLRDKLGDAPFSASGLIHCQRGVGYSLYNPRHPKEENRRFLASARGNPAVLR